MTMLYLDADGANERDLVSKHSCEVWFVCLGLVGIIMRRGAVSTYEFLSSKIDNVGQATAIVSEPKHC